MSVARRRSSAAATLAVLATAGITACAGSGSSGNSGAAGTPTGTTPAVSPSYSANANPLAAMTADHIVARAVADTKNARSVRITGKTSDSGQTLKFDLLLVRGQGCEGSIVESKSGSFRLIDKGTSIWILPDAKFYRSQAGANAEVLAILNGKYLAEQASGSGLGSLAALCTLSTLLSGFNGLAGLSKRTAPPINGQPVVELSDAGDSGRVYVSDAATPRLLRVDVPGAGGVLLDFSYGNHGAITPPPASQVLDGSKYGF